MDQTASKQIALPLTISLHLRLNTRFRLLLGGPEELYGLYMYMCMYVCVYVGVCINVCTYSTYYIYLFLQLYYNL